MIMRKSPRNDVENPPGQIVNDIRAEELLYIFKEVDQPAQKHFEKPLVKELSEYEELLRKNNSENAR